MTEETPTRKSLKMKIFSRQDSITKPQLEKRSSFSLVPFSRQTTDSQPQIITEEEESKENAANNYVPHPHSHLMHQTDHTGKQNSTDHHKKAEEVKPAAPTPKKKSFIESVFCCFGTKSEDIEVPTKDDEADNQPSVEVNSQEIEEKEYVLGPPLAIDRHKKCLVLDLDETLVHSSFRATQNSDYIIPVRIEDMVTHVYVLKRPGVDEFLKVLGEIYEIVIYTASLCQYADPLLDLLDSTKVIKGRLFREHCVLHQGNYVKDLSLLNRDLKNTIIIDNSPMSYAFHPENAIGCSSFIDDLKDSELNHIQKFLIHIKDVEDVRDHVHNWQAFTPPRK